MTREEMKSFARLDEAVDEIANGCYTLPSSDLPSYNIRAVTKEAARIGRPLTEAEAEKFIMV